MPLEETAPNNPVEKVEQPGTNSRHVEETGMRNRKPEGAPVDVDLGGEFMEQYDGPRGEITDEMNNLVRNKVCSLHRLGFKQL